MEENDQRHGLGIDWRDGLNGWIDPMDRINCTDGWMDRWRDGCKDGW